jgi:hypothetical protein
MSQENVDVVLRGIADFREHGDFLDEILAPDFVWQRGRSKSTGLEVDMELAQVFTLRGGLQTHMHMYASGEEGLKAAGVSTR